MEMFDNFCTVIGAVAIVIGIYEIITKRLVGRKLEDVPKERQLKFLPFDVATYIGCGILMMLLGLNAYLPFMNNGIIIMVVIVLSIAIVGMNAYFGNKILGTPNNSNRLRK